MSATEVQIAWMVIAVALAILAAVVILVVTGNARFVRQASSSIAEAAVVLWLLWACGAFRG